MKKRRHTFDFDEWKALTPAQRRARCKIQPTVEELSPADRLRRYRIKRALEQFAVDAGDEGAAMGVVTLIEYLYYFDGTVQAINGVETELSRMQRAGSYHYSDYEDSLTSE